MGRHRPRIVPEKDDVVLRILWIERIHGFKGPALVATDVAGLCGDVCIYYSEANQPRA